MSFFLKSIRGKSEFQGLFTDYVDSSDDEKEPTAKGQSGLDSKLGDASSLLYTSSMDTKVQKSSHNSRANLFDKLMNDDDSDEDGLDSIYDKEPLQGKPAGSVKPPSHTVSMNDEALQQFVLTNHDSTDASEEGKAAEGGMSIFDAGDTDTNTTALLNDIDDNDNNNTNVEANNDNNNDNSNIDEDEEVFVIKRSTAPHKPPKPYIQPQQLSLNNSEKILYRDEDQFIIVSHGRSDNKLTDDGRHQGDTVHVALDLSELDTTLATTTNSTHNKNRNSHSTYSARHIRSMIDASVQENKDKLDHQILSNAHRRIPEATSVLSVPKGSNHMSLSSVHVNESFSSSVGRSKAYSLRNHKIHREIGLAFAHCSKTNSSDQATLNREEFHMFAVMTALVDEKMERHASGDRESMVHRCFDAIHSLPLAGIEETSRIDESATASTEEETGAVQRSVHTEKERVNEWRQPPEELMTINLKQVCLFCELVMDLVDLSILTSIYSSPFNLMTKAVVIGVIKEMKVRVQSSGFGKYDADRRRHLADRLSRKEDSAWSSNISMKVYNKQTRKLTMKTNKTGGNDKLRINKLNREVTIALQEVDQEGDGCLDRDQFNQVMHLMGIVDSVKGYTLQPSVESKESDDHTSHNDHNGGDGGDGGDGAHLDPDVTRSTNTTRYIEDGGGPVDVTTDNLFSRRRQHSTHKNEHNGIKFGKHHLPNPYEGRILSDIMVRQAGLDFSDCEPVYDQQNLDLVYRVFDSICNLPTDKNGISSSGNDGSSDDYWSSNVICADQLMFYLKMLFGFLDAKTELEAITTGGKHTSNATISLQQKEDILKTLEECKYKKISSGYGKLDQKKREYHKTVVAEAKFQREVNTFQPILYAKQTVKKVLPSEVVQSKLARYRPGSGKYEGHLKGTKAQPSRITLMSHLQPPTRDKSDKKTLIEREMQRNALDGGKIVTSDAHLSIEADIDILQEEPLQMKSNAIVPYSKDVYLGSSPVKRDIVEAKKEREESMLKMSNRKRVPPPPPSTRTSNSGAANGKDDSSGMIGIECGVYSSSEGLSRGTLPSLEVPVYYYNASHPPSFAGGYYTLPPQSPPPRGTRGTRGKTGNKGRPHSPSKERGSVSRSPQRTPIQMLDDSGFSVAPALPLEAWNESHSSHHDWRRSANDKRKFFNSDKKGVVKHNKHLLPNPVEASTVTVPLPSPSPSISTSLTGWDAVIQEMRERKMRANKTKSGHNEDDGDSLRKGMLRPVKVGRLGSMWKHKYRSDGKNGGGRGRGKTNYGMVIDELQYKLKQLRGLYKKDKKKGAEGGTPSPSKASRSPRQSPNKYDGDDGDGEKESGGTVYEPIDNDEEGTEDTGLPRLQGSSSPRSIPQHTPQRTPQRTPALSIDPYAAPATAPHPAAPPLPPSWPPMLYKKLVKDEDRSGAVDSRPLFPSRSPERAVTSTNTTRNDDNDGNCDGDNTINNDGNATGAAISKNGKDKNKGHKWKVEKYFGICNGSSTPTPGERGGFPAAFPTNTVYTSSSPHRGPGRGRAGLISTDANGSSLPPSRVSFVDTGNEDGNNDHANTRKDGQDSREKVHLPDGFYIASADAAVQPYSILSMGTVNGTLLTQLQDMLQAKLKEAEHREKQVQRLETERSFGNYKSKEAFYKSIQHLQKARAVREERLHRENLQKLRFYEHRRLTKGAKGNKRPPPPIPATTTVNNTSNTSDGTKNSGETSDDARGDSNGSGGSKDAPSTPKHRLTSPKPFHLHTDQRAEAKTRVGTSRQLPSKSFIEREEGDGNSNLPLSYFGVKSAHNVSQWQHVDVVSSPSSKTLYSTTASNSTGDGNGMVHNHEQTGNNLSNVFFASKLRDKETGFHHKLPHYDTDAPNTAYTDEPKLRVTNLIAKKAEVKRAKKREAERAEKEKKRKEKEYKEGLYQKAIMAARKRGVRSALDEYMDSHDSHDAHTAAGDDGNGEKGAGEGAGAYLMADNEDKEAADAYPYSPGESVPDSPLMLDLQQGMRALKGAHTGNIDTGAPSSTFSPIRQTSLGTHLPHTHTSASHSNTRESYAAHVYAASQRVHRQAQSQVLHDRRQERVHDYILHSQRGGQRAKKVSEREYQSTVNRLYYGHKSDGNEEEERVWTEVDTAYLDFLPQQYGQSGYSQHSHSDYGTPTSTTVGTPSTQLHTPPTPPVESSHGDKNTLEARPAIHFSGNSGGHNNTGPSYDPYYHHQLLSKHHHPRGGGGRVVDSPSAGLPPPPLSPPDDVRTPHKIVHTHEWKEFDKGRGSEREKYQF